MNVGLALEIDSSIDGMSDVVTELDEFLKSFFREKTYGSGVDNLAIGVILTSPDVDHMHTKRALKYRKRVIYKSPAMEFTNVVEYDVKPSFQLFSQLNTSQARKYLAGLLVESIAGMKKHRDKFPTFDIEKFESDFKECLRC